MKKTFLTFGVASVAVAAPLWAAVAAADGEAIDGSTTTSAEVADDESTTTAVCPIQDRDQSRDRLQECDRDGTGDMVREQVRERVHADDGAMSGAVRSEGAAGGGYGAGVLDGSGPIHEGPADGTGNQYGAGN